MENKYNYKITILTATYNRIGLLKRLYESLMNQSIKNFEWIIVDDDSTDGTDEWIKTIQFNNSFCIKYKKQQHGGKHRAINKGVQLASGEYIFIVDSDDLLPNNSIETVIKWLDDIGKRDDLAGVSGLMVDPDLKLVGEKPKLYDKEYIECSNLERYKKQLMGDKAEVYKTEILKKYPFPEIENEFFVTERLIWDKIASDGYKIRWYNVPIYICEYQQDGLSRTGANMKEGHINNFNGYVEFIKQAIRIQEPMEAVTYFREYNNISKYMKLSLKERASKLDISMFSYIFYYLCKMPFFYFLRLIFL